MMKVLLIILCFLFVQCKSAEFTPVELFVIRDTVKDESFSLLDARLKYAKMLQPRIKGDSLVMAENLQGCPHLYVEYVQDFIGIMNRHLRDMNSRMRMNTLVGVRAVPIEKLVLYSLIRLDGRQLEIGISKQEADKLGIGESYCKIDSLIKKANPTLPSRYFRDIMEMSGSDIDISIFCDFRLLNESVCPIYGDLKKAFNALNALPKYRDGNAVKM